VYIISGVPHAVKFHIAELWVITQCNVVTVTAGANVSKKLAASIFRKTTSKIQPASSPRTEILEAGKSSSKN
jgi:hypothetical protein